MIQNILPKPSAIPRAGSGLCSNGVVIGFSCSDAGWIDILQRASSDGGRTWSSPRLVVSDPRLRSNSSEWHTIGDALPVNRTPQQAVEEGAVVSACSVR